MSRYTSYDSRRQSHVERGETIGRKGQDGIPGKGLSSKQYKTIGGLLVLLSAASTGVIPKLLGGNLQDTGALSIVVLSEVISWIAIPLYAWLLVQGYRRTRNVWKYCLRLGVLAVISEVPYDLATSGRWVDWSSQNPVFALLVGLVMLVIIDYAQTFEGFKRNAVIALAIVGAELWVLIGRVFIRQTLFFGGCALVGFVVIFRLMDRFENTMMATAGMLGAVCLIAPAFGVVLLHYRKSLDKDVHYTISTIGQIAMYAWYPLILLLCGIFA